MEWLNYHHLLYFWMVAREGTVAKASEKLSLAQPTISGQLRALEDALGHKLFERSGRHLALTEAGRLVYSYADEIFGIGRELLDTLSGKTNSRRPGQLRVGVADSVPKLTAYLLLAPAWRMEEPLQVVCREGSPERLFAALAAHEIDVIVSDAPLPPTARVKAFSHLIGHSPVAFFGVPALAARHRRRFPQSLNGAPVLLPGEYSAVRRTLDDWFEAQGIRPSVIGVCDDRGLLNVCGQAGHGLFPAPAAIAREVRRQYHVALVGTVPTVHEYFYLISAERRLKHPAVVAITETGRQLFPSQEVPQRRKSSHKRDGRAGHVDTSAQESPAP